MELRCSPASGLVAALEPVMRACGGTWIAHGSGSADRETVDAQDHIRVPPDEPSYTLRRVWLSEEEADGYYYGLANVGLWPLCHIAFIRPTFRESDWQQYAKVNERFADAVAQESKQVDPVGSRPGLSLRTVAADDPAPDATGDHTQFLAYSMAQC
jgi:trehalose 6-phosphate synthase